MISILFPILLFLTVSYSQGKYFKNNNNASLNYRSGKFNLFANYSLNRNKNFTRLYALRTYLEPDESTVKSFLEQPSFMTGKNEVHNIRTGIDFFMNQRTTLGLTLTGLKLSRSTEGNNPAIWMNAQRDIDSTINTKSEGSTKSNAELCFPRRIATHQRTTSKIYCSFI